MHVVGGGEMEIRIFTLDTKPSFTKIFLEGNISLSEKSFPGLSGVTKIGDGRESLISDPNV
jgi:hypothetical protein